MKKISLIIPLLEVNDPVIIVGNSPSVLKEKKGKEIDDFNTVIRFNDFKITDNQDFIGNKTDLIFISNSYFVKKTYSKNDKVVLLDNSLKIKKNEIDEKNYFHIDPYQLINLRYKYGPFKNFLRTLYFKGTWLNLLYPKNLTIGMVAILLLIESKIKPTIYGIDFNYKKKSHYYKHENDYGSTHSYFYERKLLENLKKENLIKIL